MTIRKWSLLAAAMLASGIAAAQTFPSKTVRLISGVTPGSASDTMARIVAEKLTASLGQSVIVENWLGAGGLVGASRVAKGDPDEAGVIRGVARQVLETVLPGKE